MPNPRLECKTLRLYGRRAKEKRERLRSAHLAPDYLPLGGAERLTSQRAEPEGPKAAEEDSASDEDDLDMRMRFVGRDAPKPVLPAHDAHAQVGCIHFSLTAASMQNPHVELCMS